MKDLGWKYPKVREVSASPEEYEKEVIHYPSLNIGSEYGSNSNVNLGDDIEIGKEITAIVKLKVRSMGQSSNQDGKKRYYCFDVMGIELQKKPSARNDKSLRRVESMAESMRGE